MSEAHILRGAALAGLNEFDKAIKEIEEAIALDPKEAVGYISLGNLQLYRDRQKEAEASFLRALEVDPKSVRAHLALANFYWATQRPAESERYLLQTLELDPANLDAHRAIATFYIASNRPLEAEPHLKKVAEGSGDAAARLALADYYLMTDRQAQAVAVLGGIDATNRAAFSGARARLAVLQYQTDPTTAHATLEEALKRNPTDAEILTVRSRILLEEKKLDGAVADAKQAVAAQPQSAAAQYALGIAHLARNELNEAIAALTEVTRLNPRAPGAHLQLARAHLSRGGARSRRGSRRGGGSGTAVQPGGASRPRPRLDGRESVGPRADDPADARGRESNVGAGAGATRLGPADEEQRPAAARAAYEAALRAQPDLLEAVAGLVQLDVNQKQPAKRTCAHRGPRCEIADGRAHAAGGGAHVCGDGRHPAGRGDADQGDRGQSVDAGGVHAARTGLPAQRAGSMKQGDSSNGCWCSSPKSVGAQTMVGIILQAQGNTARSGEAVRGGDRHRPAVGGRRKQPGVALCRGPGRHARRRVGACANGEVAAAGPAGSERYARMGLLPERPRQPGDSAVPRERAERTVESRCTTITWGWPTPRRATRRRPGRRSPVHCNSAPISAVRRTRGAGCARSRSSRARRASTRAPVDKSQRARSHRRIAMHAIAGKSRKSEGFAKRERRIPPCLV